MKVDKRLLRTWVGLFVMRAEQQAMIRLQERGSKVYSSDRARSLNEGRSTECKHGDRF